VPVGTAERLTGIIGRESGGGDFDVVSNPEFLREGSAIGDFMKPDRVIIGSCSEKASRIVSKLYEPLDTNILLTDPASAEMIKYASNAFLATKLSFINAIANICSGVGADVEKVAQGMGADSRIGPDFLEPGPGFGGSCFPKDCKALIKTADDNGYDLYLLKAVMQVNEDQKRSIGERLEKWLGSLKDRRIGVLGLAFKPETDDMRESAAINVTQYLREKGAIVRAYDPVAMDNAREVLGKDIEFASDAYEAAKDSDAVVLLTHWNEFKDLDYKRIKSSMKQPYFLDTRNFLNDEEMNSLGFIYRGIGKATPGRKTSSGCPKKDPLAVDCTCCSDKG
jgi:UDPglucose 6-dehydrogenase